MIRISSFRNYSSWIVLGYDTGAVMIAWLAAYIVRYNLNALAVPMPVWQEALKLLPFLVISHLAFFRLFRTYRPLWRFSSLPELVRLCKAIVGAWAVSLGAFWVAHDLSQTPRSIWVIYPLLLISLLAFGRLVIRYINNRIRSRSDDVTRVLIIGAGQGAELFLRDLEQWPQQRYAPVAMLDDDKRLIGKEIHGVPIVGNTQLIQQAAAKIKADLIVIAIPSIDSHTLKRIMTECEATRKPVRILPSLQEIAAGKNLVAGLREVSIEDLLGRDPIQLDWSPVEREIRDTTVLVTGGGGSIGSELCRQILKHGPRRLIILDHSEFNLYQISQELTQGDHGVECHFHLVSISDENAIDALLARYQPRLMYHAAAYKHVPMLEHQIDRAIKNNILGTYIVAEAAVRHRVAKFVMISTDKAVNPTNVMGASKRAAEILCQNLSARASTQFVTVRFGNVLGSAGSVVPLFKKQIAAGGPVTVTDPQMTRYFMTIPEASQLVLQAGALGHGGEIFVLDMGEPVKIVELAEKLIRLSGKEPHTDIAITYSGLRPGEKLYEELFYSSEPLHHTAVPKILVADKSARDWAEIERLLTLMQESLLLADPVRLYTLLQQLVPTYQAKAAVAEEIVPMRYRP